MPRPSQREAILDAAERVVVCQGAARMTLDAVAAEAGVGKGGLIYHFPSKQALLHGLLGRLIDQFQGCIDAARCEPAAGGNRLQTQLKALAEAQIRSERLATALIAVAVNAPEMMATAAERERQQLAPLLAQGAAGARAAALRFAIQGIFLLEQLGIRTMDRAERDRVIAAVLELAGESGCACPGSEAQP